MRVALLLLVLAGCAPQNQLACTMEARACADGSYVGRNPAKNCAFDACPNEPK